MYIEGYFWEGLVGDGTSPAGSGGGTTEQKQSTTFSGAPGEMAAFGFKETTI